MTEDNVKDKDRVRDETRIWGFCLAAKKGRRQRQLHSLFKMEKYKNMGPEKAKGMDKDRASKFARIKEFCLAAQKKENNNNHC